MDILIGVDDSYIKACATMLLSLSKNTKKNVKNTIYFMKWSCDDINYDKIQLLKKYLKKDDSIVILDIPKNNIINSINRNRFSDTIFLRMLAPYYLPKSVNKVLYLDADIIFQNDITGLYNSNNNAICGIQESNPFANKLCEKYNISDYVYLNSGFLLIDVKKYTKLYTLGEFFDKVVLISKHTLTNPDQDILNYIFVNNKTAIKNKNYVLLTNYGKITNEKVYAIHYVLTPKPWDNNYLNYRYFFQFWKYGKKTFGYRESIKAILRIIKHLLISVSKRIF